jgi:hypothetical protein
MGFSDVRIATGTFDATGYVGIIGCDGWNKFSKCVAELRKGMM